jgi:hypothetical protein
MMSKMTGTQVIQAPTQWVRTPFNRPPNDLRRFTANETFHSVSAIRGQFSGHNFRRSAVRSGTPFASAKNARETAPDARIHGSAQLHLTDYPSTTSTARRRAPNLAQFSKKPRRAQILYFPVLAVTACQHTT